MDLENVASAYTQPVIFSPQLSGTEILDAIESETSGTLKKCYIALGESLRGFENAASSRHRG